MQISTSCAIVIWINTSICSEFCRMVKKIYIYTSEEAKRLSPKRKLPVLAVAKPDSSRDTDMDANCNNLEDDDNANVA